tara:strand:- start:229 stop:1071 length:843 start_codon:yes stop_codon:yes gene_type:complete
MSNAILPLAMLGSMMSSIGVVGYGVQTEWEFLGKKDEEPEIEFSPSPQQPTMGGVGSMIVDDFVIQGNTGEDDVTSILDDDIEAVRTLGHAAVEGDNIQGLSAMPIGCSETEEDGELTAIREFEFTGTNYSYSCSSLENPGELKFGSAGNYVTSRGNIENLHQSQALCASNQALVGFVLDQNKSKSKLGYRFDCVNLKGPAKVRTALTRYQPYNDGVGEGPIPQGSTVPGDDPTKQLNVLKGIGKIKCNEDELLQGFAVEKSGNNIRYIYRCVTPDYEAD